MKNSQKIIHSLYLTKEASGGAKAISLMSKLTTPIANKASQLGGFASKQWMKIPGMARYGLGTTATLGFPSLMYMGGKSEAEDHVANKAYEDAYNLTQQRIGKEWSNLPAWQRYAASTLGIGNSLGLKNWLTGVKDQGLTYSTTDGVGNKTYY